MNEQIDKTINFSFKATLHVWSALASTNQLWYTFYVYLLSFESLEIYLHYEHHFFLCGEKSWQFSNIKYDFFCLRFSKYSRIYATESLKGDLSVNILFFYATESQVLPTNFSCLWRHATRNIGLLSLPGPQSRHRWPHLGDLTPGLSMIMLQESQRFFPALKTITPIVLSYICL